MHKNQPHQIIFEQADVQNLPVEKPDITLIIEEKWDGSLMIRAISATDYTCVHIPAGKVPDPAQCWEQLIGSLQDTIDLDGLNDEQRQSVWLDWKGTGKLLYERFMIDGLCESSATWPLNAVISIETNEAWIPWELIHDGDDFWGRKFVIARKPTISDHSSLGPRQQTDPHARPTHPIKVTHVIGGGFKDIALLKHARNTFSRLDCQLEVKRYERSDLTLAEVVDGTRKANVIHFTCHGYLTPSSLRLGSIEPGRLGYALHSLSLKNIRLLEDIAYSVVFANACNSNRPVEIMREYSSFGWEFYRRGVNAYIGALGSMPTQYAIEFAEIFYTQLFSGKTVGESLRYAKKKARESNDNPFWLLYSITGDPFTRKS